MSNNIEEDIKAIRKLTGYFEFFIKTIIEDKRFTEIKEKNGITEQKYKKTSFSKAIENILADRERLEVKANAYDSLVEKIKEKIEELKNKLNKTYNLYGASDYEFIKLEAKIEILQELLDTEK